MVKGYCSGGVKVCRSIIPKEIHQYNGVIGFFYGAAKVGHCTTGRVLFLNDSHGFTFRLHCGSGSNMKDEFLALRCICKVDSIFCIVTLMVYGDSRVTINGKEEI